MTRRCGHALAILALAAAACTSDDGGAAPSTTPSSSAATTTTVELTTTTAPGVTTTIEPTTTTAAPTTIAPLECGFDEGDNFSTHAGNVRNVLFVPADSTEPTPLLILFHGFASIPELFAANTGLLTEAGDAGVSLAVPYGSGFPITWEQEPGAADDVGFITSVFDDLADDPCIDADNIWLAGYSAGAGFAGTFACSVADRIAGLAMNAAVAPPLCSDLTGFDVVVSHGTADIVVPYDGLTVDIGGGPITLPPSPELAAMWADNLSCTADVGVTTPAFEQQRWTACGTDANTVDMLTYVDGGHRWPGRPNVGGEGLVVDEPDLTCVILSAIAGATDPADDCTS